MPVETGKQECGRGETGMRQRGNRSAAEEKHTRRSSSTWVVSPEAPVLSSAHFLLLVFAEFLKQILSFCALLTLIRSSTMKPPLKCCQVSLHCQLLVVCPVPAFTNALGHMIWKLSFPLTSKTSPSWLSLLPSDHSSWATLSLLTQCCFCPSPLHLSLNMLHVALFALWPELPQHISPVFISSLNSIPYFHLLPRQLLPDIS